jgi:hypothetical protein
MGISQPHSSDDLESLEETLVVLSDALAMDQVQASERAVAAGEPSTSLAELRRQLERRRGDGAVWAGRHIKTDHSA